MAELVDRQRRKVIHVARRVRPGIRGSPSSQFISRRSLRASWTGVGASGLGQRRQIRGQRSRTRVARLLAKWAALGCNGRVSDVRPFEPAAGDQDRHGPLTARPSAVEVTESEPSQVEPPAAGSPPADSPPADSPAGSPPAEPAPAGPAPAESAPAEPKPPQPTPDMSSTNQPTTGQPSTDLSPTNQPTIGQPLADLAPSGLPDPACQLCGRVGSGADLLQWAMDRRAGRISWTCPSCAAANLRSLEAKLDPEWW